MKLLSVFKITKRVNFLVTSKNQTAGCVGPHLKLFADCETISIEYFIVAHNTRVVLVKTYLCSSV